MFFGRYGMLAPYPQRSGGRATHEALFLESFKRAFPDVYSRDNDSIVVGEHIVHAREKASLVRVAESIRTEAIPHSAHLSLRDWAQRLGVEILPSYTAGDLRRALVAAYEDQAGNALVTLREKCAELLGDSFVALKRAGDKKAKVISCAATVAATTCSVVYPLVEIAASLAVNGLETCVGECIIGQSATTTHRFAAPGTLSAALGVSIVASESVWFLSQNTYSTTSSGVYNIAAYAPDTGATSLLIFVVVNSATTTVNSVEHDGVTLDVIGTVTADDGVSTTDLAIHAYLVNTNVEGNTADIDVDLASIGGTSASARIIVIQLEGADSATSGSSTSITGEYTISTTVTSNTDADPTLTAPSPTYWAGNPAPADVEPHLLNGVFTERSRYRLLARRGSVYESDDAVKQRIDGAVHKYLSKKMKSTECYDYSIGDLEGFILNQSRLGYVAF